MSNSVDLIDLSSSDEVISISDDEGDGDKNEAETNDHKDEPKPDIVNNQTGAEPSASKFFNNAKLEQDLRLAIQRRLSERKNMGSYTVKPVKPLKLKQKTWSQVKTEREKEKMAMSSPKMPRLDKEPVHTIESSSESDNEELPDLDDYSEVICISDDEIKSEQKVYDDKSLETDTEEDIIRRLRNYSTSTDDDDVTIVRVQIVESDSYMEDTDVGWSPKSKRRKISGSPLPENCEDIEHGGNVYDLHDESKETVKIERSEVKTETIKKVFNRESQNKLTNILNQMKFNFKSMTQSKNSEKETEQSIGGYNSQTENDEASTSYSSSKNRHFMDSLMNGSDNEDSDVETRKPKRIKRKSKMRKIKRRSDEGQVQGHITSYYSFKKEIHKKCFWQRHKTNISSAKLDQEVDTLIGAFSQVHINTVEGCWEDENAGFMRHGMKFVVDFSQKSKPPSELIQRIIHEGIVTCKSEEIMKEAYDCLMAVYEKYPDIVHIDFKVLQDTLEHLNFGQSFSNQDSVLVRKTIYILQLIIFCFEDEMISKNISDLKVMRKTSGYRALSYDCSFNNVKELVNYIVYCLTNEQTFNNEIPEILPLLQKLLHISIEVSSNTSAAAKAIATELTKSYIYLPSIDHKRLLVHTMESNLLRYKLVTCVLEKQCEFTVPCYEFPKKLQEIFSCFFNALPPINILTPPTTPQSDDESNEDPIQSTAGYPAIYVEELLMLLFEVLQCYVQCNQDQSSASLRRRAYMKRDDFIHQLNEQEKDSVLRHVEELREHVLKLTPEITPTSEHYLMMMLCVIDWQRTVE